MGVKVFGGRESGNLTETKDLSLNLVVNKTILDRQNDENDTFPLSTDSEGMVLIIF